MHVKMAISFMVLLVLSAATIATVSIASNMSLLVPTGQMQGMMSLVDSGVEPQSPDPVDGGGGGPG